MDKKFMMALMATGMLLTHQISAYAVLDNIGDNGVNVPDAGTTTLDDNGINFDHANGYVLWNAGGVNIGNDGTQAVGVGGDEYGHLEFESGVDGASVFVTGDIGATGGNNDLGLLQFDTTGSVYLNGDVWTNTFLFSSGATVVLGSNVSVTANNGVQVLSSLDEQTLTLTDGDNTVNGDVGQSGFVVNKVNASATTGTSEFNGDIYATTLNVTGSASTNGAVAANGDIYGDVNFQILSNNSGLELASGKDINGDVRTENDGIGRVDFLGGTQTVTGSFGGANELGTIYLRDGTVNFQGSVSADRLAFIGAGLTGTAVLSENKGLSSSTGFITFTDDTGIITLLGNNTIQADLGDNTNDLYLVNAKATGTTTFYNDIYTTALNVTGTAASDGTIIFEQTLNGNLNYQLASNDASVELPAGATINGNVSTENDNYGVLNLTASNTTVHGNVGSALKHLYEINSTLSGADINLTGDVYTNRFNIDGNIGTVNIGGDLVLANNASSLVDIYIHNLSVAGNFVMPASSDLNIGMIADDIFGTIDVAGAAVIPSTVEITVTTWENYITDGATFKVVDSTSGAGVEGGNTVVDDNTFVTFTATHSDNQDLILVASRSATQTYLTHADSSNTSEVATVLDTLAGQSTDMDSVLAVIDTLDPNNEMDDAFGQLIEDVSAGVRDTVVGAHNDSVRKVWARMSAMRYAGLAGVAAGDGLAGMEAWGQIFGSYQEQDTRDGVKGYDANVYGVVLGADKSVTESIRAGLSLTYADSVVDFAKESTGDTDIESYQTSLYASYQLPDAPWYLSTQLSYGLNEYEGSRRINFGAINRTANSDYSAQQYSLNIRGAYEFKFSDIFIAPMASLQYMNLEVDGYTETGADSLNLRVDARDYDFFDMELGAELKSPIYLENSNITLVPALSAMYVYEFNAEKEVVNSRFTGGGASFRTEGAKPAKNSFKYGVNLEVILSDDISLDFAYSSKLKEDYQDHNAAATFRMKF